MVREVLVERERVRETTAVSLYTNPLPRTPSKGKPIAKHVIVDVCFAIDPMRHAHGHAHGPCVLRACTRTGVYAHTVPCTRVTEGVCTVVFSNQ
jgi:hypothetical protein